MKKKNKTNKRITLYNGSRLTVGNMKDWIAALRSGKYKQSTNSLQGPEGYCCLGVACELFIPKSKIIRNSDGHIIGDFPDSQPSSPVWLRHINQDANNNRSTYIIDYSLSELNDCEGYSFEDIADALELNYLYAEGLK